MVRKIKDSGANAVFCQKGVDDVAQYYFSREGIYLVTRVKESDMKSLGRSTGARIVSSIDEISKTDLGN